MSIYIYIYIYTHASRVWQMSFEFGMSVDMLDMSGRARHDSSNLLHHVSDHVYSALVGGGARI